MEDITDLVFKGCDELDDLELLAPGGFDLFETMSAFELMDPKMDLRIDRGEVLNSKKAIQEGIIDPKRSLSHHEMLALMNRILRETASWLSGSQMQQSLYTCLLFSSKSLLENNPILVHYFEAFHYLF